MIIGSWSPFHGTYSTANLLAIAECIANTYDKKVLIMQTHFTMNNLEKPLLGSLDSTNESIFFKDIGLDAVVRHFKSGSFNEESVANSCVTVSDNLSLLAGTRQRDRSVYNNETEREIVAKIIRELGKMYDVVLVDTNAGLSDASLEVLNVAERIIVNLRQNKEMIETTLNNAELNRLAEKAKFFYCFGAYDDCSKLSIRNVRRNFKKIYTDNSGVVPYLSQYNDAISDCRVHSFLSSMADSYALETDKDDDIWYYSVDDFAEKITRRE